MTGQAEDQRQFAPAAARNREPIWSVLGPALPQAGLVLEIASGSGEHVAHFASRAPADLIFQPSDPTPEARASIDAWVDHDRLPNVRPAIELDASIADWPVDAADAVLAINMIHIAPIAAMQGLVRGASRILPTGGLLYLYGPFRRIGVETVASNEDFDRSLKERDPRWGLRNLEDVVEQAAVAGFAAPDVIEMPANNLSVLFRRGA